MIKLGPTSGETKAMSVNDIFLSRLKLLIIMAKAYLKNYPIGKYRRSAVIENAHHVFYHSLQLVSETFFFENRESESQSGISSEIEIEEERVFHQRVQLLAVMVKALAEERLTGHIRKKALQDNLDRICDTLTFTFHIKDVDFLKVA
jgi:two-component sensor histidine kinase